MDTIERYALMVLYPCQFGSARFKGVEHLSHILWKYEERCFSAEHADYEYLISETAAKAEITPEGMKQDISRYVMDGWTQGFSDAWEIYTGWSQDTPPDACMAIKLICESFSTFVEKVQALAQRAENAHPPAYTSSEERILEENHYVSISNSEADAYVCYLTYRVEHDLYEICKEGGELEDMSWAEFVLALRGHKPTCDISAAVMRKTVLNYFHRGHFNFNVTNIELFRESDTADTENDWLHCAKLFPDDTGRALVGILLFRAEQAYYGQLLNRGEDYSWEEYIEKLAQEPSMWSKVIMAFRDAIARLNFKPVWLSEELEGMTKVDGG